LEIGEHESEKCFYFSSSLLYGITHKGRIGNYNKREDIVFEEERRSEDKKEFLPAHTSEIEQI
jgi:hypothetical protein